MRRSFNRFKPDGRGWHQDYGRHQEAAKYGRASEKVGTWSSEVAPAGFLNKYYPWLSKEGRTMVTRDKHGVKDVASEEMPTRFLSRWYPYLPENVRGTPKEKEALIGGVADNVPDEAFDEMQLQEGVQTEREHTTDPKVAKEIAKDHIAETGKWSGGKLKSRYYDELQQMEGNLQ